MYHTGAGKCKMFWLEGSKQRKWLHSFSTFQVRTQEAASNMHPWWHFLKTYCIQNLSLFEFLGLFYGRMKWQSWKSSFHFTAAEITRNFRINFSCPKTAQSQAPKSNWRCFLTVLLFVCILAYSSLCIAEGNARQTTLENLSCFGLGFGRDRPPLPIFTLRQDSK